MTYQETTDWLFSQLPMYQRVGQSAYRKDLHNIKLLAAHLCHPEHQFKSIHVGGTNGKGSCSHMLASVFQEAGYKVGLYTSPHLKDFRERIRINGKMIAKEKVVQFVEQHQSFFEEHHLSFFEMTVGLAFQTFSEEQVDMAVIEVGMGGRLDATNIILPELSIITNIGFDHVQFLGDTRPKIAKEKAGIIKQNTPVVIGELHPETQPVFQTVAEQKSAPITFAEHYNFPLYESELKGLYQQKNQRTVQQALKELKSIGWNISEQHIKDGIAHVVKNTHLKGRWQQISTEPLCIAETAHNLEGMAYVAQQIQSLSYKKLFMVMGFVNDKSVQAIIQLLPKDALFYFSAPKVPRAMSVFQLQNKLKDIDKEALYFSTLDEAFHQALTDANSKDFIFIGGSIFTVAELIPDTE